MFYRYADRGHSAIRIDGDGNVLRSGFAVEVARIQLDPPADFVIEDAPAVSQEEVSIQRIRTQPGVGDIGNDIAKLIEEVWIACGNLILVTETSTNRKTFAVNLQ